MKCSKWKIKKQQINYFKPLRKKYTGISQIFLNLNPRTSMIPSLLSYCWEPNQ